MSTLKDFVFDSAINTIEKKLDEYKLKVLSNSFNLFTISSYNSYLENFHSDILAFIVDPNAVHQNKQYLELFLIYIKKQFPDIDISKYKSCVVTREKGRIDIWIRDETSKKSIIIENKINNAADQERQLERYYEYAKTNGYDVDAIIYLSLTGDATAPYTKYTELNNLVLNIAAYQNDEKDLCKGWLEECYKLSSDADTKSFIYQYLKLLNHLSQNNMNREIQQDFYDIVCTAQGQKRIETIVELAAGLLAYRAELFASKIGDNYLPFTKRYRYRPSHWLYENYIEDENKFKLDVYFHDDGSARIDLWNPHKEEKIQAQTVYQKLTEIGLENDFKPGGFGGGYFKDFEGESIKAVDENLVNYVQNLFLKLQNSKLNKLSEQQEELKISQN